MAFEGIIGQEQVITRLLRMLGKSRVPHALLFHGPEGVGKDAVALEMAKALICQRDETAYCGICPDCSRIAQLTHPDVHYIFPAMASTSDSELLEVVESFKKNPYRRTNPWANPSISIERIREIKRITAMKSFENKGRVVIFSEAQRMTVEATNSLLKILEEPPEGMTIILTSSQPVLLLPTIISRCQSMRFTPLAWEDVEQALIKHQKVDPGRAKLVAKLSRGSFRHALELLEEALDEKREKMVNILRTVLRNDAERLILVDEIVRTSDKKTIQEYLELMLIWFRDAMILSLDGNRELLANQDRLDTLEKFCQSLETIDFHTIIDYVERVLMRLNRYVYVNLLLINLFNFLNTHLRRKHG